jgi:hypothetical protein
LGVGKKKPTTANKVTPHGCEKTQWHAYGTPPGKERARQAEAEKEDLEQQMEALLMGLGDDEGVAPGERGHHMSPLRSEKYWHRWLLQCQWEGRCGAGAPGKAAVEPPEPRPRQPNLPSLRKTALAEYTQMLSNLDRLQSPEPPEEQEARPMPCFRDWGGAAARG